MNTTCIFLPLLGTGVTISSIVFSHKMKKRKIINDVPSPLQSSTSEQEVEEVEKEEEDSHEIELEEH